MCTWKSIPAIAVLLLLLAPAAHAQVRELECQINLPAFPWSAYRVRIDYSAKLMSVKLVERAGNVRSPPYFQKMRATITEDQAVAVGRWPPSSWSRWSLNRRTGVLGIEGFDGADHYDRFTEPCQPLKGPIY